MLHLGKDDVNAKDPELHGEELAESGKRKASALSQGICLSRADGSEMMQAVEERQQEILNMASKAVREGIEQMAARRLAIDHQVR